MTDGPKEMPTYRRPQHIGIRAIDDVESLGLNVLPHQRQGETPCAAEDLHEELAAQRSRHHARLETLRSSGKVSSTAVALDSSVGDTSTSTLRSRVPLSYRRPLASDAGLLLLLIPTIMRRHGATWRLAPP